MDKNAISRTSSVYTINKVRTRQKQHIFKPIKLSKKHYCCSCNEYITFGQKASKCQLKNCQYLVHKKCIPHASPNCPYTKESALMERTGNIVKNNESEKLHIFIPERLQIPMLCNTCNQTIKPKKKAARCAECNYHSHIKCLPTSQSFKCSSNEDNDSIKRFSLEVATKINFWFGIEVTEGEMDTMHLMYTQGPHDDILNRNGFVNKRCFSGDAMCDLLIENGWKKEHAVKFGKKLYKNGIMESVLHNHNFSYSPNIYRFNDIFSSQLELSLEQLSNCLELEEIGDTIDITLGNVKEKISKIEKILDILNNGMIPEEFFDKFVKVAHQIVEYCSSKFENIAEEIEEWKERLEREDEEVGLSYQLILGEEMINEYSHINILQLNLVILRHILRVLMNEPKIKVINAWSPVLNEYEEEFNKLFTIAENSEYFRVRDAKSLLQEYHTEYKDIGLDTNEHWFKKYFYNHPDKTNIYRAKSEDNNLVYVILKEEVVVPEDENEDIFSVLRGLFISDKGVNKRILSSKDLTDKSIISHWQDYFDSVVILMDPTIKDIKPAKTKKDIAFELILEAENIDSKVSNNFKIGLLVTKPGQVNEDQFFENDEGSDKYNAFLEFIGETIYLEGWENFSGGLDTSERNNTGECSVYTTWEQYEIMWHVSTLIPSQNEGLV
eukprot:TRINITY_DN3013_c0_g1_i3.p1 TRINITY_DN3013_c0_g1~~TRINITY_DN3013_c0_g1_i3.p1  ORF type:complete len:667 (+),score=138.24 TRINITY_DN3013_c0_g1_i3:3-2003(+)